MCCSRCCRSRFWSAGQMLVLLIGQIDLSMTAVMAMGSIVSASVMTRHAADVGEPGGDR